MIFKALVNCSAKFCKNEAFILLNSEEGPPGIVQIIAPEYEAVPNDEAIYARGTIVNVENTPQNAKKFIDGHISKWRGQFEIYSEEELNLKKEKYEAYIKENPLWYLKGKFHKEDGPAIYFEPNF